MTCAINDAMVLPFSPIHESLNPLSCECNLVDVFFSFLQGIFEKFGFPDEEHETGPSTPTAL